MGAPIATDVAVVGGGPAGSATAIACAVRGLRVVLFERDLFASERPGETLHPGIEPLLAQLGIADRMSPVVGARHNGIWIEWGGSRRFDPFGADDSGPWTGFQVWRADFDALLIRRARELGVDVRQPCTVTGIIDGPDGPAGVTTAEGVVPARIVVDATGRTRWLGRTLGIASPSRSPRFFVRYGYAKGACPERERAPLLVGNASGWTWTAMVRPDTYQWTRLAFDGSQPPRDWMPDEFCHLTPTGRSRGADVTWRMADAVAKPGWFMVGDAAGILDPTSSHGVLRAIVSGMTAGHLIGAVLRSGAPPAGAAIAYQEWFAAWFNADATRLSQFYRNLNVVGLT